MIRYIELIEPFDQNGNVPNSVMATSQNGDWVLYGEAQAEIDVLKAENKRLQEKCKHSAIARFNWRNKYLTLIGSIIAILGLEDLTARDDVVLAVEALKAQNAELLALLKQCRTWMADGENSDDSEFYPDYAEPAYIRLIQETDKAIAKTGEKS